MTRPNPRGLAWVPADRTEGPHDPTASAGLFVGVRNFTTDRGLSELVYAVDDAIDLAHLFSLELGLLDPGHVHLALAGEPEKPESAERLREIEAAGGRRMEANQSLILHKLPRIGTSAGPDGMFFLSFATHGFNSRGTDYLVAADSVRLSLLSTGIQLQELFEKVGRFGAERRLILLDTCRETLAGARSVQLPEIPEASGQMVLYGASSGGYSFEDPDLRNGVFTSAVLAGLRGEAAPDRHGFITANALADFVEGRVTGWLREKHPELVRLGGGIERRMSGLAGHIRLAASAFQQRRDAALDRLRRNLGGPLNGALFDRILARLETVGPSEVSLGLIREIEALDGGDRTRRNLVLYFEHEVHRAGSVEEPFRQALEMMAGIGDRGRPDEGRDLLARLASGGNCLARLWLTSAAAAGDYDVPAELRAAEKATAEDVSAVREMATGGSGLVAAVIGYSMEIGVGCEVDSAGAVRWYGEAAKQDEPVAMQHLGFLYSARDSSVYDFAEAHRWYRRAAELGHPGAARNLGFLFKDDEGGDQDLGEARRWFERAARMGNATASRWLGIMLRDGQGGPKDLREARRWLVEAAEQGDAQAMGDLAVFHTGKYGVERDEEEMRRWARAGADAGNTWSMSYLAAIHADAGEYEEALSFWRLAAEEGEPGAMCGLGDLYAGGLGVEPSDERALHWYLRAADAGNMFAMYNLGSLYQAGRGVPRDLRRAAEWFQRARDAGHQAAAAALADLSSTGSGAAGEAALDDRPFWKKPSFWKSVGKTLIGS